MRAAGADTVWGVTTALHCEIVSSQPCVRSFTIKSWWLKYELIQLGCRQQEVSSQRLLAEPGHHPFVAFQAPGTEAVCSPFKSGSFELSFLNPAAAERPVRGLEQCEEDA